MTKTAYGCLSLLCVCLLLVALLGVWLFGFAGMMPWATKTAKGTLNVIAERKNADGETVQQLLCQLGTKSTPVLMTPEGARNAVRYKISYFVRERNGQLKKLAYVSDNQFHYYRTNELSYCDKYRAVDDGSLWVGTGKDPEHVGGIPHSDILYNDFHVVVLDETHIVSHRVLNNVVQDGEFGSKNLKWDPGNRILTFNTTSGLKRYDVLADKVEDVEAKSNVEAK